MTLLQETQNITTEDVVKLLHADEVYYNTNESEISKFFAGKCVFLTGGSGFLGKLITEKLLRACPDLASVFLLVRPKKEKDIHTRMDEIYNDVLYHRLAKVQPKFRHKIILVNGDVSLPGLGMSIEDRKLVTEKVSVIIHCAATVKFHEKLHLATNINLQGTKEMITLAKECSQLESFVHVSTAYSNADRYDIDEKFYDPPLDPDRLMQITNATPPAILDKITKDIVGDYPNTYCFTKVLAEEYIRMYGSSLPICIVRPAIVIATYKEPLKSWIDNIYGVTGIVVGSGLGVIRCVPVPSDAPANIVPGDVVSNCIIAASYKTALERKSDCPIYNCVAAKENVLTWAEYMHVNEIYGMKAPPRQALWVYTLQLISNPVWYWIYRFFVHIVPGFLMDIGLMLTFKKPQMLAVYKKIHVFGEDIKFFGHSRWNFHDNNTRKLYKELSDEDKKLFFFDMTKVDWNEYFVTHCAGLRNYLVKEQDSEIPMAKKRYFKLYIASLVLKMFFVLLLLKLAYSIACWIL